MKKKLIPVALGLLGFITSCAHTNGLTADVFIYQFSDTYIGTVRTALETNLKEKGVTPKFYDAGGVQATQTQQIESALSTGSQILLANLVEQTATGDAVAEKAKAKDVPVIFFNREVPDSSVNPATYPDNAFVGTDPDQAGYMQGEILAGALIKDGAINPLWDKNGDGKINYVMLRADESNAEANGRTKYSVQEANRLLAEAGLDPLVHLGEDYNAGWSKDNAKQAMDNFISTYGLTGANAIECVIANNDDMALGAVASLQTQNYNKGGENALLVVGVDATAAAQAAIDAGEMYGTVKQDAEAMAQCIAELTANKLAGKDFLDGTSYAWDSETVHKIRIPYGSYTK
ncbi:MAG: galactose ABC transporter substrate-binding protein [Bacilli bacterium]|nr:galactose ABC transporter substrate-binding protein [Bacilli bacterium]MCH4235502.1 galactose ABC transporter substrate-binding protein [Bacilli bacterium]